jgi:hypothetical protein
MAKRRRTAKTSGASRRPPAAHRSRSPEPSSVSRWEREGALLERAITALEEGEPDAIEAVRRAADDAGAGDIARVLELLVQPADSLRPTAIRAEAKRRGLGVDRGFPYLDLLRMLAAWREPGGKAKPPPKLSSAASEKAGVPALSAAVDGLKGPGIRPARWVGALRQSQPRAAQLWDALRYAQNADDTQLSWWRRPRPPSGDQFPQDRWPELHGVGWREQLKHWIADPTLELGEADLTTCLEALGQRPERAAWLKPMLEGIAREVEAARPERAARLADASCFLLPGLPCEDVLGRLLEILEVDLVRLAVRHPREVPTERLVQLWSHPERLHTDERAALAEALCESRDWADGSLPEPLCRELGLHLLLNSTSFERQLRIVREQAEHLDPSQLRAELPQSSPPWQRELLLGLVHLGRGEPAAALRCAVSLAEERSGVASVMELLTGCAELSGQIKGPVARRALERLAALLAKHPPQAYDLLALLVKIQNERSKATRKRWASSLRPVLRAASMGRADDDRGRASLAVSGLVGGDRAAPDRVLRAWARGLPRQRDGEAANASVLHTIAWALGLASLLGVGDHLGDWPERLVAFLRRVAKGRVAEHVDPFAGDHPAYTQGLARLHELHSAQLGNSPPWTLARGVAAMDRGDRGEGQLLVERATKQLGFTHRLTRQAHQQGYLDRVDHPCPF